MVQWLETTQRRKKLRKGLRKGLRKCLPRVSIVTGVKYTPSKLCENKKRSWKAIVEAQHKYNDIIFENDSRICEGCLNELPKQQVINEKVQNQKLVENVKGGLG